MPCLDTKTPTGYGHSYADWDVMEQAWRCLDCGQLSEPGAFHDRMCSNCDYTTDTHIKDAPTKCPECGGDLVEYAD